MYNVLCYKQIIACLCSVWKCFRNFRILNLPLGKQGLAQMLFHVINTEILKVFRTSAKHQKSYTVLPHHIFFFNVDTVVITFVRIWIHFDMETDLESNCQLFSSMPRKQCHLVAQTGHQAQKPHCCPVQEECFRFIVCLLDDILVRLAVTRELTRAIWVPLSSQQEAGKTVQRASPP